MNPRPTKKQALIAAALSLVAEQGYSALTLDGVGQAAGVSKGGVLYHFPTKDALVVAMIEQLAIGLDAAQPDDLGGDPKVPGAAARAYLESIMRPTEPAEHRATFAMLAAVAHDPDLLAPLQEQYRRWGDRLDADGLPGVDAQIVRLAADGLWVAELFELAPPDPARRSEILTRLEQLTHPTAGEPK